MDYSVAENGSNLTVQMQGKLSFTDNPTVRDIISHVRQWNGSRLSVDLSQLESIDSAGLGMLTLINDSAQDAGKAMVVSRPQGQVAKMLDISSFDELMTIER